MPDGQKHYYGVVIRKLLYTHSADSYTASLLLSGTAGGPSHGPSASDSHRISHTHRSALAPDILQFRPDLIRI